MNSAKKALLVAAGSICIALAVLGVFLPLLPTTPFLLLASACYVRSSERLHGWLMGNRLLGGYIRNFKERRGIPLRGRVVTVVLLWPYRTGRRPGLSTRAGSVAGRRCAS